MNSATKAHGAPIVVGSRVQHVKFGTGVVMEPISEGTATVDFGQVGEKKIRIEYLEALPQPANRYAITATPKDQFSDLSCLEYWCRRIDDGRERDIFGVDAYRVVEARWTVLVWVMSAVRDEPLEGDLRRGIRAALRAVAGVTRCTEEDRELWGVEGCACSEALVSAVANVIDQHEASIRVYIAECDRRANSKGRK